MHNLQTDLIADDELSASDAAELFGVALITIHRWADQGQFRSRYVRTGGRGRGARVRVINRNDADEFLAKREIAREALADVGQTLK